jgi:hypothetical protein
MTQTSLIESVLQDLNLFQITNKKTHHPLAIFTQIRKELHVKPSWNYYLVIGKLNYIAQNTCPDISFVIHQCAHCSCNPIALHVLAMKCIGCYRIGNIWNLENMLSRSAGYIYTNCGCPIHWASKLQSENCTFHGKTWTPSSEMILQTWIILSPPLHTIFYHLHHYTWGYHKKNVPNSGLFLVNPYTNYKQQNWVIILSPVYS